MSIQSYKIILLGNSGVGKTAILNRFVNDRWIPEDRSTISPDFQFKSLQMKDHEIRLEIWDLVGMTNNHKGGLNRIFSRQTHGVIMVASITDTQSIQDTAQWKQEVNEIVQENGQPIPMILCVNKVEEVVDIDDSNLEYLQTDIGIVKFAQQNGFINGFRVSAKEDINVSDAFSTLTREMILNQIRITSLTAADKKKGGGGGEQL